MAKAKTAEATAEATTGTGSYSERRWLVPKKRADGYAQERKAGVHMRGKNEGNPLSEYEKGLRSGYLLAQSDHTGIYKYKQALAQGMSKAEARAFSRAKKPRKS